MVRYQVVYQRNQVRESPRRRKQDPFFRGKMNPDFRLKVLRDFRLPCRQIAVTHR